MTFCQCWSVSKASCPGYGYSYRDRNLGHGVRRGEPWLPRHRHRVRDSSISLSWVTSENSIARNANTSVVLATSSLNAICRTLNLSKRTPKKNGYTQINLTIFMQGSCLPMSKFHCCLFRRKLWKWYVWPIYLACLHANNLPEWS